MLFFCPGWQSLQCGKRSSQEFETRWESTGARHQITLWVFHHALNSALFFGFESFHIAPVCYMYFRMMLLPNLNENFSYLLMFIQHYDSSICLIIEKHIKTNIQGHPRNTLYQWISTKHEINKLCKVKPCCLIAKCWMHTWYLPLLTKSTLLFSHGWKFGC